MSCDGGVKSRQGKVRSAGVELSVGKVVYGPVIV